MIPIRYLENCNLKIAVETKRPNGTIAKSYNQVAIYQVNIQDISDAVSATVYGEHINNMKRLMSPVHSLENFLIGKLNTTSDNISKYFIEIGGRLYKIVSAKKSGIDIELI